MPTHSQLAAQLLRDAAAFFRTIAEQNEPLKEQMAENAAVFEEVALLVETNPMGELPGSEGGAGGDHGHHHHHDHDHEGGCCGGHDKQDKEGCDGKGGCSN
ncbi:MAG: hypothetical protein AUJ12_08930 [Alphaproteobacteria bacterium CG1_02_46_17]|nr:MAG: hypothetical protein AUJ12_08930 [Alphaproteobacteria bacterium CG1_02_46_17]